MRRLIAAIAAKAVAATQADTVRPSSRARSRCSIAITGFTIGLCALLDAKFDWLMSYARGERNIPARGPEVTLSAASAGFQDLQIGRRGFRARALFP
jgi:hypothetical protein